MKLHLDDVPRWTLLTVFAIAAFAACLVAGLDACRTFGVTQIAATFATAGFTGAIAYTILHGRHERGWVPWVVVPAAMLGAFAFVWFFVIATWAGCLSS